MNGFLHERKMLIKIKNTKSESFTSKYGVPKVSPVSPVLFIIVCGIPQPENVQTTTLSQFADDIALWAYGRTNIVSQHKIQKISR